MSGLMAVFYFLFTVAFSLVTFVLWIRLAIRYFKVSALHPISHMVFNLTDPIIAPFSKFIKPSRKSRYDWVTLSVLIAVLFIKYFLIDLLFIPASMPLMLIIFYVLASLIVQPCNILFYALLARVILSWVNPTWQHPIAELLFVITEPLLRPIRNIVPTLAGLDFSPLIGMVVLNIPVIFIGNMLPMNLL